MRMRLAVAGVLGSSLLAGALMAARATAADPRRVVIAELFTSEGCSSCPPADALLQQIASEQPIPGVEVIALEEHVDYWDGLGWRDPFSSPLFTKRQSEYDARVFRSNEIYTPQLVVNGTRACVGSDRAAARRALSGALPESGTVVRLDVRAAVSGRVPVVIAISTSGAAGRRQDADVVVAITESNLKTDVRRGENGGRTVPHSAVVRSLAPVAHLPAGQATLDADVAVPLAAEWNRANLRVVAFLQERDSRLVLGAATAPVISR